MKCESMRIARSKTPSLCSYNINSTSLHQVHTHKHLGVILSSDLSWKMHVLTVGAKANKILRLLKRTFGKCSEAIITGYKTMVVQLLNMHVPCGILTSNIYLINSKKFRVMSQDGFWRVPLSTMTV